MCLLTTNRSLGEWSKDMADILVELIPLVERGKRLPSVNEVDREVSREDIVDARRD